MKKLVAILLFFLPHPVNGYVRRLLGQVIHKTARVHIFTLLIVNNVEVGPESSIGPLVLIKLNRLKIGRHSKISPLNIINCDMIDGADLNMGNHSRIFPMCWIEPGEGIEIGSHVGVGGHTLMFTHGVWSDYLKGGPVAFGSIQIEDHVWLPWRVFIMPGVTIGEGAIIGANSTVTKSVPKRTVAAGSPAKVVRSLGDISEDENIFSERLETIFCRYEMYCSRRGIRPIPIREMLYLTQGSNSYGDRKAPISIDMNSYSYRCNEGVQCSDFISFLRQFGIRLERGRNA